MPRERKNDILGRHGRWEYTILGNDFSDIDKDAKSLEPPAGTLSWRGYSYPDIAFASLPRHDNEINGPWWLPDDCLWGREDLLLSILSKAVILESVPVIKDYMLLNSDIEIVRQEIVYIPFLDQTQGELKRQLHGLMRDLVTCNLEEKEQKYTELVSALKNHRGDNFRIFKVRMCLLKFPHRIWIEGIYHTRIHPAIIIPTNIYERYHTSE